MKKPLLFLLILALFGAVSLPCMAASTTQPVIHVRDCDAKADTSQTVTGNVYLSQLPTHWTLDYDFGLAAGHTAKVAFSIDGAALQEFWQPPYCPAGHNTPLSLKAGPHTIAVTVNGVAIAPTALLVAAAPPVVVLPADQIGGQMGTNAAAVNDPMLNLATHPQYLPFIKAANLAALRVWTEGSWTTHQPANYYSFLPAWHDAGVKVILVANFQNSAPRCSCPSDADWTGWLSAIPPPAVTGAWAVEVGNEVNTATYFTGSSQQLTHLMQIGYPILHAKGYVLIAPSTLNSVDEMKSFAAQGAYQWCDYVNTHSYRGTPAQVLADVDAAQAIANAVNKPLAVTEWGTRPANKAPPTYAPSQAAAIAGLLQRPVLALQFPLYVLPGNVSDTAAPFDVKGDVNQPFYDSFVSAVGK